MPPRIPPDTAPVSIRPLREKEKSRFDKTNLLCHTPPQPLGPAPQRGVRKACPPGPHNSRVGGHWHDGRFSLRRQASWRREPPSAQGFNPWGFSHAPLPTAAPAPAGRARRCFNPRGFSHAPLPPHPTLTGLKAIVARPGHNIRAVAGKANRRPLNRSADENCMAWPSATQSAQADFVARRPFSRDFSRTAPRPRHALSTWTSV